MQGSQKPLLPIKPTLSLPSSKDLPWALCLVSLTKMKTLFEHFFVVVLKQGLITQAVLELTAYLMSTLKSWCSGLRIPSVVDTSVFPHTQQEHSCLFQMLISDHTGLPVCLIPYKMERLLIGVTSHYTVAKTALCSEWLKAMRKEGTSLF